MSENKFKIGDKVICIEDATLYSSEVDAGEHYTVRGVSKYNNLSLEEVSGWWDGSRFELIQEEQQ